MSRLVIVSAAFALVGVLVATGSRAAFTDVESNSANSLTAGTVDLVDDDSGSAMFSVANMVPGQIATKCIVVTYQGSVPDPATVKLYSGGYTDSGNFADYLNLTIKEGSGGSFADCTGFSESATIESGGTLTGFGTTHTNYGNGAGTWDPSGTPESTTYEVTFELDAATPNAEQGESVTALVLTWEVSS